MGKHENLPDRPDATTADAELTEDGLMDERDAAGTDEWARLSDGAGLRAPNTRENWRVT